MGPARLTIGLTGGIGTRAGTGYAGPVAAESRFRFTFDFGELNPRRRDHGLRVLDPEVEAPPAGAVRIAPAPAPRWLGRLLPVFRCDEPLRVVFGAGPGSMVFATILRDAIGALIAAAGAESGIAVMSWPAGLAVGPRLDRIPLRPQAWIVAADLTPGSVVAAAHLLDSAPAGRAWLVLNGAIPRLDRDLGLKNGVFGTLAPDRLVRLPMVGGSELASVAAGISPGLEPRFGRPVRGLARAIVEAYREQQA